MSEGANDRLSGVGLLRCPHCHGLLRRDGGTWGCEAGHRFDVARQGHVTLLAGATPHDGDSAPMLDARTTVLAACHLDAVTGAVVDVLDPLPDGAIVEVGAGTGHHLWRVLEAIGPRPAVAMDVSTPAVRRAARSAPPDAVVVRADAWQPWPVVDRVAAAVLTIFGPRNPAEAARVLAAGGAWVVVTPRPEHLAELRDPLGLLEVDADKRARLADDLAPAFVPTDHRAVVDLRRLDRDGARALALMGPAGHHLDPGELDRRAAVLPAEVEVTVAVDVHRFRVADPRDDGGADRRGGPARQASS